MTLDRRIAEHVRRVEALQREVFDHRPSPADAGLPEQLNRERAATVRAAIDRLQRDRRETIARFDAEITARETELRELESSTDVDFGRQQSGSPGGSKPSRKSPTRKRKDSGG
jgi:hypothetical protein